MKLYYKPGACSLASHIILHETNSNFEIESVDTTTKKTDSGGDFNQINPNGYVPALQFENDEVLTEGAAIMQFLADQNQESNLAPAVGTLARARMQEHLNYTSSELHKAFGPLFSANASDDAKKDAKVNVINKLNYVEKILSDGRLHLLGDAFSVADSYLFVVMNWANFVGIELANFPHISTYMARISTRPAVQKAMQAEGLLN